LSVGEFACSFEKGFENYKWLIVLSASAALIGHSRSIFLGFKGGKSAATGLGTLFALDFRVGSLTFLIWMIVLYISKIVSIASILATASCIPLMIFFRPISSYICYCILGFIYVTLRHKANFGRILAGTEPKIGGRST
jgi:acyl phosphate:glycerol-3-phosphate acyltransferase